MAKVFSALLSCCSLSATSATTNELTAMHLVIVVVFVEKKRKKELKEEHNASCLCVLAAEELLTLTRIEKRKKCVGAQELIEAVGYWQRAYCLVC